MENDRRYLAVLLVCVALGLLFVAAVNIVVDPVDVFGRPGIKGFNLEKTRAVAAGGRLYKSLSITRGDYDTLILGTSRAMNGIDPNSKVLAPARAYNAALSDGRLVELREVLGYALHHLDLKRIIYQVDFFTFSGLGQALGDFEYSRFNQPPWQSDLYYISSGNAFLASIKTVWENARGGLAEELPNGFRDRERTLRGHSLSHQELFDLILTRSFFVQPLTYAAYEYSRERVAVFEEIVEACMDAGVDLYIATSPVHARQLEAVAATGLWPAYEQWLRDLAAVVEHRRPAGSGPRLELWDFSGYDAYTTEPVPDDPNAQMRWYWESSHYTAALGDRLLARLLDREDVLEVDLPFGERLTPENVEERIRTLREGRLEYRRTAPREVAEVKRLAELTRRFRVPERRAIDSITD